MDERCRETLIRLWDFAGLGPLDPALQQPPSLEFDDVTLDFASSEDEQYLVISTVCGTLDDFGTAQAQSLERLLQLGFALLHDHDVLLHADGQIIRLSAFHRYDADTLPKLTGLLSDVAAAAHTVARIGRGTTGPMNTSREKTISEQEAVVIFQP